jgi:hypothetical protein
MISGLNLIYIYIYIYIVSTFIKNVLSNTNPNEQLFDVIDDEKPHRENTKKIDTR